ncbi:hypothetical protein Acr_23g0016940 [Actinidia rufa]|uniref:Uncharacterized protein n=1 Tax=Actinidia rufa TaxID=165716 RepID=A0A7J0GR92_9ERIC|nr:hypothetical protein Acr_23g0016940 [Actinidia rufa]
MGPSSSLETIFQDALSSVLSQNQFENELHDRELDMGLEPFSPCAEAQHAVNSELCELSSELDRAVEWAHALRRHQDPFLMLDSELEVLNTGCAHDKGSNAR